MLHNVFVMYRGLVPVFSASSELPASVDRALLWWVSKVGQALAAQHPSEVSSLIRLSLCQELPNLL